MLLTPALSPEPYTVLVLCTGNSARSIMAEALFNHLGKPWFRAFSTGSRPTGRVHPYALEQIERLALPVADYASKSWQVFAQAGAPEFDFVITVCDSAAREPCPLFRDNALLIHWGLPDPVAVEGTPEVVRTAFAKVFETLKARIEWLMSLPLQELAGPQLAEHMQRLAQAQANAIVGAQ